jgi:hypothetical protein
LADNLDSDVLELIERILGRANQFLVHAKHYEIEFLYSQNPTYEEIASHLNTAMQNVQAIIFGVDPHIAEQIGEYCWWMTKIGAAIKARDPDKLRAHCEGLDKKSFVMPIG